MCQHILVPLTSLEGEKISRQVYLWQTLTPRNLAGWRVALCWMLLISLVTWLESSASAVLLWVYPVTLQQELCWPRLLQTAASLIYGFFLCGAIDYWCISLLGKGSCHPKQTLPLWWAQMSLWQPSTIRIQDNLRMAVFKQLLKGRSFSLAG